MRDISILPIFNQATPGIWGDFLRIRSLTMKEVYQHNLNSEYIEHAQIQFQTYWEKLSCNFAFGAYDNNEMIGCINGYVKGAIAYVSHLYVLPQYHGMRIGTRLLGAAETAMSTNATSINLTALGKAYGFYEKMGYTSPTNTNEFVKNIKKSGACCTSPVFFCTKNIADSCTEIIKKNNSDFNFQRNLINKEHKPLFIYRDANLKINAFGVADEKLTIFSANPYPADWACKNVKNISLNYLNKTK